VFGGVSLLLTPAWLLFKPTYSSSSSSAAANDSANDDSNNISSSSANLELMPLTTVVYSDSDDDADSNSDVALTQHTSAAVSSSSSTSVSRDRDSTATAATATAAVRTVSLLQELKAYGARREVQAILIAQFTQSVSMAGLLRLVLDHCEAAYMKYAACENQVQA
jgi:hypothetical protein